VFLAASGMPEVFVAYMMESARALDPLGVFRLLQSTFISYGGPDEPFAYALHEALQRNGVSTFFFPIHAVPGRKLHRVMREGVNSYDRVILICSKESLARPGVLNEIEEALQREARQGGKELLIPVAIDDFVYDEWMPSDPGVAQSIRDRVIADFRGAVPNQERFHRELVKLVVALRK
jgi:TIR domain